MKENTSRSTRNNLMLESHGKDTGPFFFFLKVLILQLFCTAIVFTQVKKGQMLDYRYRIDLFSVLSFYVILN